MTITLRAWGTNGVVKGFRIQTLGRTPQAWNSDLRGGIAYKGMPVPWEHAEGARRASAQDSEEEEAPSWCSSWRTPRRGPVKQRLVWGRIGSGRPKKARWSWLPESKSKQTTREWNQCAPTRAKQDCGSHADWKTSTQKQVPSPGPPSRPSARSGTLWPLGQSSPASCFCSLVSS